MIWDKQVAFTGYTWRHQHEFVLFCESETTKPVPTGDGDILACRAVKIDSREHLAQKPVDLLSRLISKSSATVVCDPFMGSGSTALAALNSSSAFIGIEREPKYFDIAVKRIDAALNADRDSLWTAKQLAADQQRDLFASDE